MTNQIQPIFILPEGAQRQFGKDAQRNNIAAAKLVAETVRTTLGPKGMDKMLVDTLGDVVITNDGVTILEEMSIEHPAAKMMVEIAKTLEKEVGDGTTTAVVIAGELLARAEHLLDENIHPTIIAKGYNMAAQQAQKILLEIAKDISSDDHAMLKNIAGTAITGKGADISKEVISTLIVDAILQVMDKDNLSRSSIKVEKKIGQSVEDSTLIKGIVVDKERVHPSMPQKVQNAKVLLIDSALELRETETDAKIQINDPSQMQAFLDQEEKMLKKIADLVIKTGATVVITQKGIDDMVQHYLAKQKIYAVRRVKKSDMEKLAQATGAQIVNRVEDASPQDLGHAGLVHEVTLGDEQFTYVEECKNPKAVTILVRGGTEHVVDEICRAIDDAIGDVVAALKDKKVVGGAGAPEVELARRLRQYADTLSGREQLAVLAFADALEIIPKTLAENAGLDPIDVITALKARHEEGDLWAGVDVYTGKPVDSMKAGVIEPLRTKTQAVKSASEVAIMILRIDDVIGSKQDRPSGHPGGGMPQGMM